MKRDWDLIRTILNHVRDSSPSELIEIANTDDTTAEEHFKLLQEAGLIEYLQVYGGGSTTFQARLTWEGHDFIESAQNEAVYKSAIEKAKAAGGVSFEIIKAVIAELVKRSIFPE